MADIAQLSIKLVSSGSESLAVSVPSLATATVLSLKQLIEAQDAPRFPVAGQRLIFQGQILQDDRLLVDYNVANGCALHLTLSPSTARGARPSTASPAPTAATSPSIEPQLRALLQQMRTDAGYATAVQTMQKICANVIDHPHEDKYRKLRLANAALKSRLLDRVCGLDCVRLLGFQSGIEEGHLVLVPTAERWENLVVGKRVLDSAAAATAAAPLSFSGGGIGTSDWATQVAQSVSQNPALYSHALQHDPMLQQMVQRSPELAQSLANPALLLQQLQQAQQNPAMLAQMTQLMQNPHVLQQRMQELVGGNTSDLGSVFGGFGGAAPAPAPAAAANPFAPVAAQQTPPHNPFASNAPSSVAAPAPALVPATSSMTNDSSDTTTFDEDEIADAIARSLQDQS